MDNFNYDCTGNEAVKKDCPKNNAPCPTTDDFVSSTELTCKGKTLLIHLRFELRKTNKKGSILFY